MGHDIGLHNAVAGILRFDQCVRVGRNISPEILNRGPLTIDLEPDATADIAPAITLERTTR